MQNGEIWKPTPPLAWKARSRGVKFPRMLKPWGKPFPPPYFPQKKMETFGKTGGGGGDAILVLCTD